VSTLFSFFLSSFYWGNLLFSLSLSLSLRRENSVLKALFSHTKKIGTMERSTTGHAHALVYYFFYEYLLVFY